MKSTRLMTAIGMILATGLPPALLAAGESGMEPAPAVNNEQPANPLPRRWKGHLPSGHEMRLSIVDLGDGEYLFKLAGNFSGTYKREGDKLVMSAPADPRLSGFVWKIRDEQTLVLIAQPDVSLTGSDYTGTILRRTPIEDQPRPDPSLPESTP